MTRATGAGALDPPRLRASQTARRHDLDRLRVLAVLLLLPFHSARVFNVDSDWYVKNPRESPLLSWFVVDFLDPWHMPLLFVLAGMATWFALGHRSPATYVRERTSRLLVPAAFGILVIVPPQPFLAQLRYPGHESSYLGFLTGGYFTNVGDLTGYDGAFTPGHMWFVVYLFVFSLVALPLFAWLRRRAVAHDIGRAWMLVATPFLLLLAEAFPSPADAWSPFTTLALFVCGFVLASSETLGDIARRRWKAILSAGVATMAAVYAVEIAGPSISEDSVADAAYQLLESSNTWLWVLGLIGAAGTYLARPSTPSLRYANEAAYPWYILHQTVIVAVAYVVVGWDLGVAPKYLLVLAFSTAITLMAYEFVVRRAYVMRFLFGVKPRAEAPMRTDALR